MKKNLTLMMLVFSVSLPLYAQSGENYQNALNLSPFGKISLKYERMIDSQFAFAVTPFFYTSLLDLFYIINGHKWGDLTDYNHQMFGINGGITYWFGSFQDGFYIDGEFGVSHNRLEFRYAFIDYKTIILSAGLLAVGGYKFKINDWFVLGLHGGAEFYYPVSISDQNKLPDTFNPVLFRIVTGVEAGFLF